MTMGAVELNSTTCWTLNIWTEHRKVSYNMNISCASSFLCETVYCLILCHSPFSHSFTHTRAYTTWKHTVSADSCFPNRTVDDVSFSCFILDITKNKQKWSSKENLFDSVAKYFPRNFNWKSCFFEKRSNISKFKVLSLRSNFVNVCVCVSDKNAGQKSPKWTKPKQFNDNVIDHLLRRSVLKRERERHTSFSSHIFECHTVVRILVVLHFECILRSC